MHLDGGRAATSRQARGSGPGSAIGQGDNGITVSAALRTSNPRVNASESIALWTMALTKEMTVGDVGRLALPGSTFADIGMRAAISGVPVERRRSVDRRLAGLLRA